MAIIYHKELTQGSDDWLAMRCGLLTASEMKLIVTPTFKIASNEKERAHLYDIVAQRITKYVEPAYISDDMLRGQDDEDYAKKAYSEHYAPVEDCGFITNDDSGFVIGASPDGLVGDDGLVEVKSRRAKFQVETILSGKMPDDYMIQVQTLLLVSGRKWCDFISYSAGLPMKVIRVLPDAHIQEAIVKAASAFEAKAAECLAQWEDKTKDLVPTERRLEQEIYL
jgi:putative phage-type endonuclease